MASPKRNTIFPGSRGWVDHFDKISSSISQKQEESNPPLARVAQKRLQQDVYKKSRQAVSPGAAPRRGGEEAAAQRNTVINDQEGPSDAGNQAGQSGSVASDLSSRKYKGILELQFGAASYFLVAQDTLTPSRGKSSVAFIQSLSGQDVDSKVKSIQQINHPCFLPYREFLSFQGSFAVAFDYAPLSLAELAANPLLDELKLASIFGQVRRYPLQAWA